MKGFSKRTLSIALALIMAFSTMAFAFAASVEYGTTYGTLIYELAAEKATVTGLSTNNNMDDIKIPAEITNGGTKYTVTAIAPKAFEGKSNIKSIIIPSTVASIGANAFYNCSNLATVTFEVDAETGNSALTLIDDHAFNGCYSLTEIVIPPCVETIGDHAFANCNNLKAIVFAKNNTEVTALKTIESYAFHNCRALTEVDLPDSLTDLGQFAFLDCTGIKKIALSKGIQAISASTFQGCASLTNLILDKDLEEANENSKLFTIGQSAFAGCTSLVTLKIPHFVESIGASAFSGCSSLKNIYLPDSIESIEEKAFYKSENIANIYYEGDADAYNAIAIGAYNETLFGEVVMNFEAYDHVHKLLKNAEKSYAATCEKTGLDHMYCDCGYENPQILAALGHDSTQWHTATDATCVKDGKASMICTRCQKADETTEVVLKKTGHKMAAAATVDKAATCTADGEKSIHCTNAGCTYREKITKIPATGHTASKTWKTDKAATCTADGSKSLHCQKCDATIKTEKIPAAGHKYGAWTVIVEATATTDGEKKRVCSVCKAEEKAIIPKTAPDTITISPAAVELAYEESIQLTASYTENIVWVSSNPNIASVDADGYVTATGEGNAVITATIDGTRVSASCTVTVKLTIIQKIVMFFQNILAFILGFFA